MAPAALSKPAFGLHATLQLRAHAKHATLAPLRRNSPFQITEPDRA
jgi:hypothetical protein